MMGAGPGLSACVATTYVFSRKFSSKGVDMDDKYGILKA